jgi:hypothetical protein
MQKEKSAEEREKKGFLNEEVWIGLSSAIFKNRI